MPGLLVHEWIDATGGSERVLDALAECFPDADILCLWNDAPGRFPGRDVEETWLARTPLRRHKSWALPASELAWRGRRHRTPEWTLASSHAFAHHVSYRGVAPTRLAYVHSPARYLWEPELDARGSHWMVRVGGPPLRALDRRRAHELDAIATNSRFVRDRVRLAWDRDADVIHPPVDVERIQSTRAWSDALTPAERAAVDSLPGPFLLGASRFVPYKRLDLVVRAGEACGLPVVLAGAGPQRERLLALAADAAVPVAVVDSPRDALLYALYERALAYVFPAVEDFGIMPVEAMATGCPVVAHHVGGARESVLDGVSGCLVDAVSPRAVEAAVHRAAGLTRETVRGHARRFSRERFVREVTAWWAAVLGTSVVGGP